MGTPPPLRGVAHRAVYVALRASRTCGVYGSEPPVSMPPTGARLFPSLAHRFYLPYALRTSRICGSAATVFSQSPASHT